MLDGLVLFSAASSNSCQSLHAYATLPKERFQRWSRGCASRRSLRHFAVHGIYGILSQQCWQALPAHQGWNQARRYQQLGTRHEQLPSFVARVRNVIQAGVFTCFHPEVSDAKPDQPVGGTV